MFRLFFNSCLSAVSSQHRRTADSILGSLRPWRGRGFWVVATVVTLTCTSPTGQLLGGYSVASPPGAPDTFPMDISAPPIPQDIGLTLGTPEDVDALHEAQLWVRAGQGSLRHVDWLQAKEQFARAISLDPSNGEAYLGRAEAHLRLQAPVKALEDSQRALYLLGQGTPRLKLQLLAHLSHQRASAELARRQGQRFGQAALVDSVDEALRLYPADPGLYVLRGELEAKANEGDPADAERAMAWMRKALELAPEDPLAHVELSRRLEAQGRLHVARRHAALFLEEVQTPAAYVDLARLDWLRGETQSSLSLLRESLARHGQTAPDGSMAWGRPAEVARTLFPLVSLESRLGLVDDAQRHAEQLFELENEGRYAGLTCLPALQLLQRHASAAATHDAARLCEEKSSFLAKVLGAVYRGEAELALGRPSAAEQALQDAETAHRRLLADLGPELEERPFALAAELALTQLRGKLNLLVGDRRVGGEQLQDLVERLQALEGLEGWLTGGQRLQEIGRVADRAGEFSLAISSARALEKLSPEAASGQGESPADSYQGRNPRPSAESWVVWTER